MTCYVYFILSLLDLDLRKYASLVGPLSADGALKVRHVGLPTILAVVVKILLTIGLSHFPELGTLWESYSMLRVKDFG